MKFVPFALLILSQPAFVVSLMIVDEQFSLLAHLINLNTTYYYVPIIGRIDVWSSWEVCFVILLVVYEALFLWSFWEVLRKPDDGARVSSPEADSERGPPARICNLRKAPGPSAPPGFAPPVATRGGTPR